jgi:hypothetical protein
MRFRLALREGIGELALAPAHTSNDAPAPASSPTAVQRLLALEPALPALAAVQAWLGQPWRDVLAAAEPTPWPDAAAALTLRIAGRSGSPTDGWALRLALPWAALPSPTSTVQAWPLAAWSVQWPVQPVVWQLAALNEPQMAAASRSPGLQPADVVLLPDTFAMPVQGVAVQAQIADGPAALWPPLGRCWWRPMECRVDCGQAQPEPLAAPTDIEPAMWRVFTEPTPLSLGCWWHPAGQAALWPLSRPVLAAQLRDPAGEPRAQGEIVPVGRGWALRVLQVPGVQRAPQHHDG